MNPFFTVATFSLEQPWRAVAATVAGCLYVVLYAVIGLVIVKALTRRTAGWIIASSVAGMLLLTPGVVLVAAMVFVGLTPKPSPSAFSSTVPLGNLPASAGTLPFPTPTFPAPAMPATPKTLQGTDLAYHLTVPADWNVERVYNDFDILATHHGCAVAVIAEEVSVGTPEDIRNIAQKKLQRSASELRLSDTSPVKIDGHDWLYFTARGMINKVSFVYQLYVYSGPEGTFQVDAWTTPNLYDKLAGSMRDIAMTFRFPSAAVGATARPSATPLPEPPSTATGNVLAYHLTLPPGWGVKHIDGDFDLLVSCRSLYVGVIAEEGSMGKSETLLKHVQSRLQKSSLDPQFSKTSTIRIDGHDWLFFTSKRSVDDVPFVFQHFIYSGPEGSFQLVCYTEQKSLRPERRRVAQRRGDFLFSASRLTDPRDARRRVAAPSLDAVTGGSETRHAQFRVTSLCAALKRCTAILYTSHDHVRRSRPARRSPAVPTPRR